MARPDEPSLKKRLVPLAENVAESTTACLVTMVQGNVIALTVTHWIIASQTGVVAGSLASAALILARARRRWAIAVILGVTTAIVDFFIHEGAFGPAGLEAVVTGIGAGLLSFAIGTAIDRVQRWRARRRASRAVAREH